jgi:hypothetical protein
MDNNSAQDSEFDGTPEGVITALMSRPNETAGTMFPGAGVTLLASYVSETETFTVQVRSLPMFPWEEETVYSHEEGLSAEEVVIRLQIAQARDTFWGQGEEVPAEVAAGLDEKFNEAAEAAGHPTLRDLADLIGEEAEEYLEGF